MPDPGLAARLGTLPLGRFGEASGRAGVRLHRRGDVAMASLAPWRGQSGGLAATMNDHFGIELPSGPRCVKAAGVTALGLGPDRWLLVNGTADGTFVDTLAARLAGVAAVTDQSASSVIFHIAGEKARDLLAKGVNLDLHPAAFAEDAVAATMVAQISILLWRLDTADGYCIAVPRSWVGGFLRWLTESAAEFGLDVVA
jgi:sarcosine oxidase subunit gamma